MRHSELPTRLPLLGRPVRGLALACALVMGGGAARAQIDLPERPQRPPAERSGRAKSEESRGRGIVPHLVCTICSERNYTSPRDRPGVADETYTAWCTLCARDTTHRSSTASAGRGRLALPGGARRSRPAARARAADDAPSEPAVVPRPSPAAFLFAEVAAVSDLSGTLATQAVENLLALGTEGLDAARAALGGDAAGMVVTAARVLLRGGEAADGERVAERLHRRLPAGAGPRILAELIESDPVHAPPALLVGLLDHPQQPMRNAALRRLRNAPAGTDSAEFLALLSAPLGSKRAETRLRAVELLCTTEDPGVLDLLFAHLDDPAARVASAIADSEDPRVELELEGRAFQSRWILRENAFALLAIIDREERTLRALLGERHTELLLAGMESSDPLIYGTCAAALAGIGYRSARPEASTWLDREVTGRLVAAVAGHEFHSDFSALQPRALRRLRTLTGESFGTDGPAWANWWIEHREGFYARRVSMSLAAERARRVVLRYRATGPSAGLFTLSGPDVAASGADGGPGEWRWLTERECRDVAALLEREGTLGPDRLPGLRGLRTTGFRTVEVLVDGRGKTFTFGPGESEPWFERVCAALMDLRDRNRWQAYADLAAHADARAFWEAESPWWSEEHEPLERALRLKGLVVGRVSENRPSSRTPLYEELARLFETDGVASPADFPLFLEFLRDEGFFAGRARLLVELALTAARSVEDSEGVGAEWGDRLIELLRARFGAEAAEAMAEVSAACGDEHVRALLTDERPLLRAVGATELARQLAEGRASSQEQRAVDMACLMGLLGDPEPRVEAAAALALGHARVEGALTELLVRARLGEEGVRSAALRAIGMMGGEYVIDALVLAGTDGNERVKEAAAEGLASLGDPRTAPYLIALLGRGGDSPAYAHAWSGLLRLGEAVHEDLARAMASPVHRARREAALLLARQGRPDALGVMIDMLRADPSDTNLTREITILSCIDLSQASEAAQEWSRWWESVVHDDATAWFAAALERRGVEAAAETLGGADGLEGALFLLDVMERPEAFLVERARRELERLLGRDVGSPPQRALERAIWLNGMREELAQSWDT
jgi:HEAT repeat protein